MTQQHQYDHLKAVEDALSWLIANADGVIPKFGSTDAAAAFKLRLKVDKARKALGFTLSTTRDPL